ncbi:hypothetical protein CHS0354_001187 [Potamilus streckersoni]|uniref:Uncharacterized protein n=1 Tax=Potamilus streckersoni TaxID=2493646 RepID=A0AAE0T618_9BIVA|nr:hypothetical protein CHS0354_001187 [Potamilus streckersoni]
MSQNLTKAFIEHRRIRQAQQRANKITQKINALYGNIRPGKVTDQTNSSHPQNKFMSNPQASNNYEGTATTTSHITPPRKRKDPEQEININQISPNTENLCSIAQAHTRELGVRINQIRTDHGNNPNKKNHGEGTTVYLTNIQNIGCVENNIIRPTQQTHENNEQQRLNRTAVHETWENICRSIENHALPNHPEPKETKNISVRKFQYARDTNTGATMKISGFYPRANKPLRGPPKGKTSVNTTSPLRYNTPTLTLQSKLDIQQRNTNKRKSPNTLQSTPRKKHKTSENNETSNNYTQQNKAPRGSQFGRNDDKIKKKTNSKDYHPSYLTLYLHYPIAPNKQLPDSTIISELQKHKYGRIQIKHPKPLETTIRCFTGAQIRAYKKIKDINGIPIKICNQHKYNTLSKAHQPRTTTTITSKSKQLNKTTKQGTDLLIWQWNCRGIYQNQLELQAAILETNEKPLVICLQETILPRKKSALPKINNYQQTYQKQRKNDSRGEDWPSKYMTVLLKIKKLKSQKLKTTSAKCWQLTKKIPNTTYLAKIPNKTRGNTRTQNPKIYRKEEKKKIGQKT